MQGLSPTEGEQMAYQLGATIGTLPYLRQVFIIAQTRIIAGLQIFRGADDRRQKVVEIMSYAASKLADRLEPL